MPIRSLTAKRNFCLQPRYRSVVWIETCPRRNWIWSNSPPARRQSLAQLRRRSCGASFSIPARAAAARTTSHSTLGVMPVPQTRPVLLIDRKSAPSVMQPASFHSSIATFTHDGIGTVRMCPALPRRSAITQCSSRDWTESTRRASNSPRRNPHPTSVAIMA